MGFRRSETWPGAALAVPRHAPGRHLAAHFLTDLLVSVGLVLTLGWLFQASAGDAYLRDAVITQNEIYVAMNRFTPTNLALHYYLTIDHMTRSMSVIYNPADGAPGAAAQAFFAVLRLLLSIGIAIPTTVVELYQETSGTAAWIVLVGFGIALCWVYALLLSAKISLWRLLIALAVTPFAISVVFMLLQVFMAVMLNAFFWLTELAPLAVACPVLCTLYWVAFPRADRGATTMLLRAIGRMLQPEG
jgi:hypothetical protein